MSLKFAKTGSARRRSGTTIADERRHILSPNSNFFMAITSM